MTKDELLSELKGIRLNLSVIANRTSDIIDRTEGNLREVKSIDRKICDAIRNLDNQVRVIKHGVRNNDTP